MGAEAAKEQQAPTLPRALVDLAQAADKEGISVVELIRRQTQSATDAALEAKVRKELGAVQSWQAGLQSDAKALDDIVTRMQKAGLFKEGADLGTFRTSFLAEALTKPMPGPEKANEKPPENEGETKQAKTLDPAHLEGMALANELGLEKGDPELGSIVTDQGLEAYFKSIRDSGVAKKERLMKEGNLVGIDTGTGAAGTVNPIADIKDPATLISMGLNPKR